MSAREICLRANSSRRHARAAIWSERRPLMSGLTWCLAGRPRQRRTQRLLQSALADGCEGSLVLGQRRFRGNVNSSLSVFNGQLPPTAKETLPSRQCIGTARRGRFLRHQVDGPTAQWSSPPDGVGEWRPCDAATMRPGPGFSFGIVCGRTIVGRMPYGGSGWGESRRGRA